MSWEWCSIADAPLEIIDGDRGKQYPKQNEFLSDGPCLFLNTGNVTKSGFSFQNTIFISEQKDAALRKGKLCRDDVIMTTRGTIGNCAYYNFGVPFDSVRINSGMVIFRAQSDRLAPAFLYQYLRSDVFDGKAQAIRSGAAQPQLPIRDIKTIELPLPPLSEQRRIAAILSAYDDLIENNRRRIALLEEGARQLYKEWFVRFRFPGHEHVKVIDGVPEGWEHLPLAQLCTRITDGSHSSPKTVEDGYPMASVKDMEDWRLDLSACRQIGLDDYEALTQYDCKPLKGDVLIAKDGSYLKHCFVVQDELNVVILSSIAILRPSDRIDPFLLAFTLKDPKIKEMMRGYVSGVALPRIILKEFRGFKILVPEKRVQQMWIEEARPLCEQANVLLKQCDALAKARDLLLPRLMNGTLTV